MSYDYFKEFARNSLHTSIDYVVPSTPLIGAVSGGIGYCTRAFFLTCFPRGVIMGEQGKYTGYFTWAFGYAPSFVEKILMDNQWAPYLGEKIGFVKGIFAVPETTPYLAEQMAIGSALATSLTLNLIARKFFGVKKENKKMEDLFMSLNKMGFELPSSPSKPKITQPFRSPFMNIIFPDEIPTSTETIPETPVVASNN